MKNVIILNDTSNELHYGCDLVIKNIHKLLLKNNLKIIGTNYCGDSFFENKNLVSKLPVADLVVVNGEGTFHGSQPRLLEIMKVVNFIKKKTSIPVFLINSVYSNNNSKIVKLTRLFDLIFVRTSKDKKELSKYKIKSTVVPDLTFYEQYKILLKTKTRPIGVTDSYNDTISEKLLFFAKNNKFIFLPIRKNSKIRSLSNFARYCIVKMIYYPLWILKINLKYLSEKNFYYTSNCETYIDNISNSKFLIIGRFHAACFALKTLTPFFFLENAVNTHKAEALLIDAGINKSRLIKYKDLKNLKLKKFENKEVVSIKKYISSAQKKIEKMFFDIANY